MNIEGKDVSEIIEHLKTKFDDGARWIAYQKDKESIGKDDLHFFSSCNDAQKFCKKSPSAYFLFRYSTIANVIDKLNNNDKHYHLAEFSGHLSQQQTHKMLKLSLDPEKAKRLYFGEINAALRDPSRHKHRFFLIGEFKNQSLLLDHDGAPVKNTGLLFDMAHPVINDSGNTVRWDHKALRTLEQPTCLFQSAFTNYNAQNRDLIFYNDKLRQIDPKKDWSFIEVMSYDNAPAVVIKNPVIHEEQKLALGDNAARKNMNGEEKEQVKEKQRHAIRPKNSL